MIGAICRMDNRGLGIQSKGFFDHIPCKALVIDVSNLHFGDVPQFPEWYENQTFYKINHQYAIHYGKRAKVGLEPLPLSVIDEFLKDIDVLVAFETPYDYRIFEICRERGIKTILQLNYEFLEYPSNLPAPDLFLAPSMWNYGKIPEPKMFLPVPVNTTHFEPQRKDKTFIHICGIPATHDRNGTNTFLECLKYVQNEIEVIVRSQKPITMQIPPNIKITYDFQNKDNYWENYTGGVLVLPRKYGGLSLQVNEALAAGMPVLMSDISPNNTWLPEEWLVPAKKDRSFMAKQMVDVYEPDINELAKKIDLFCDSDFLDAAIEKTIALKNSISWESLLPKYISIIEQLLKS